MRRSIEKTEFFMTEFVVIDLKKWKRREYFEHYYRQVPCRFSLTVELDVTRLVQSVKKQGLMFFPVFIHLLASVVNRHQEFRTGFNSSGELGYWRQVWPNYTVFHPQNRSFSTLWTPFSENFDDFYLNYVRDWEKYGEIEGFAPKPEMPENIFNVSCLPWVNFTSLDLDLPRSDNYLLPIFTLGKFSEKNGGTFAPLAMQFHHAVCDGFHAALLVNELQELCNGFGEKNEHQRF